jgi:hypothetical protein
MNDQHPKLQRVRATEETAVSVKTDISSEAKALLGAN